MITPVIKIVENRIPLVTGIIRTRAAAHVMRTALNIQGRIRSGMAEAKHGRIYARRSISHQASAPGEMPAVDTSFLSNSIQVERMPDGVSVAVYTAAEYAEVLELGGVHMEARPFMTPATEAEINNFHDGMNDILRGV